MAIDEERDLRQRLSVALNVVTPSPAPVAAVLRKGRLVRDRRRMAVAAGLAAAVLAAVTIPALLHHHGHPAPVTRHNTPKVTVTRLGGHVTRGLIARGTIDGRAWRINFDPAGNNSLCVFVPGDVLSCGAGAAAAPAVTGIASMDESASTRWDSVAGQVRRDVTRISIRLSDGDVLDLHPYAAFGFRWIGLVVPHPLRMVEAIAYSGQRELGYSIPFVDENADATFVHWLRPGQTGPARVTRQLGSGVAAGQPWSVTGYAGPWGYCETLRSVSDRSATCSAENGNGKLTFGVNTTFGSGGDQRRWVIGTAPPSVAYLRLTMSDGSTIRVPVVDFAGVKSFALAITKNPAMVRWGAYNSSGREVVGGQGSIDRWSPKG